MNRRTFAALLGRQSSWAVYDQVLVSGANFLSTLLVARLLNVDSFALYSLASLTILFASNLHRALFTQPLNILGAAEPLVDLFRRYRAILGLQRWAALPVALLVIVVGFNFYPHASIVGATILFALSFLCQEVIRRMHYTRDNIRAAFLNDALAYGGQLTVVAVAWWSGISDPAWIFAGFGLAFGLAFVVGHLQIAHDAHPLPATVPGDRAKLLHEHWQFSKWITLSQFVYWGSTQLYPFQLAKFVSHQAVADFNAASSILNALNIIRLMLGNYLPSRAAVVFARDGVPGLMRYLGRALALYGGLALAMIAVLAIGAPWIIDIAFHGKYAGAKTLLPFLAIAHAITIIGVIVNTGAMAVRVTDWIFYANAAGTAFSILAGHVMLTRFGVWGAVIGSIVGTGLPVLIQGAHFIWYSRRKAAQEAGK